LSFPNIGALSESDAIKALQDPTRAVGVVFQEAALKEVAANALCAADGPASF
jgi:hypothetical protein